MQLVLASSSPYRKELLSRLKVEFLAISPDVDETAGEMESPRDLVKRLSLLKARALEDEYPNAIIIGSDQVALRGQRIIGKPGTHKKAVHQLRMSSGKQVDFITGVCVLNCATGRVRVDTVDSSIHFRRLGDDQIERYLHREQPYGCAGAIQCEGLGISLLERFEGEDPTALIGLPLIRLVEFLQEEGMRVC